jgi:type IV pilus assembly protein PilC
MTAIAGFIFFSKPVGKKVIIKVIAPIPVIKTLLHQIDVARFCRIFSTLIASAVPITESLDIALNSLTNPKYASKSKAIVAQIMEGKTIAAVFKEEKLFPTLLIQMIAGGEKSGTLDSTLGDLSSFYESEVEEAVKKSTQLLEPILMLFVGIAVGGMILSIIAPMYSVVGSLQNVQ